MKKINQLIAFGALTLALNACSKDDTDNKDPKQDGSVMITCQQQDSNACATANTSCVAKCVADEACQKQCQDTFCACMDTAKCAPPAECTSTPKSDGGTLPQLDKGTQPKADIAVDQVDQGNPGECLQDDVNSCTITNSTCVATCVADEECLDGCQTDFCDCMDTAGCAPPAECTI